MILRPVRPESPCGPPTTKRPVGLIRNSVFLLSMSAGNTFRMTFSMRYFSIVAWATLIELSDPSDEVFAHVAAGLEGREFGDVGEARDFVAGLRAWAKENSIKTRDLLHPLRLALTGKNRGPEMAYLFAVLGAEEARERILRAREARLGA